MNPPRRKELLQRGLELQVREWERAVKVEIIVDETQRFV